MSFTPPDYLALASRIRALAHAAGLRWVGKPAEDGRAAGRDRESLPEEGLDGATIDAAVAAVDEADVLLVIGTSLSVHPAAGLVPYGRRRGVELIIVNAESTDYDQLAARVLRDAIVQLVPELFRPVDDEPPPSD